MFDNFYKISKTNLEGGGSISMKFPTGTELGNHCKSFTYSNNSVFILAFLCIKIVKNIGAIKRAFKKTGNYFIKHMRLFSNVGTL